MLTHPLCRVFQDDDGKLVLLVQHGLVVYKHLQGILPHREQGRLPAVIGREGGREGGREMRKWQGGR